MNEFESELLALQTSKRDLMQTRWDRDLPFDELIGDRWARARQLGFGPESSIYALSYVYGRVSVGSNVWIGPYTVLDGTGGLTIGDYCSISAGVHIYTHDTVAWAVSGGRSPKIMAPVSVGARTYVGSQSIIAKGVTIGDGCVIGANSFVNKDIPAGSLAAGSPCRVLGRVLVDEDGSVRLVRARAVTPTRVTRRPKDR